MGYAPPLASLGYDVVSLAYLAGQDLPASIAATPPESFEEGLAWIRGELKAPRIAVHGASRGGGLTIVLASYLHEHLQGALAIVPMHARASGVVRQRAVGLRRRCRLRPCRTSRNSA